MWAAWANDSGGGKTRTSFRVLSMSSATCDLLQPQLDGARLRMPFQLGAVLHDQDPELETLPRPRVELAQRDGQLPHRSHRAQRLFVPPPPTIAQALRPGEDHDHLRRADQIAQGARARLHQEVQAPAIGA